jgi:hypothetical protein
MQTSDRNRVLALSLIYVAFLALIAVIVMQTTASWPVSARLGALTTLIAVLTPNVFVFVITAFVSRRHWDRLLAPHLAIVGCFAALATYVVLGVLSGTLTHLLEAVSPAFVLALVALLFIPGILAAQLLRFGWGIKFPAVPPDLRR